MEEYFGTIVGVMVVFMGFIGNAMFLKGSFGEKIKTNKENIAVNKDSISAVCFDLHETKKEVRFSETCNKINESLDRRVIRLETSKNGK